MDYFDFDQFRSRNGAWPKVGVPKNSDETLDALKTAKQRRDVLLFEYLKARYYYFSNRAGITLKSLEGDIGPVDEKLLQGYLAGKESSFSDEYEQYKMRPGFK